MKLALVAIATASFVLSGCGSGGKTASTQASPSVVWADGVCSAVSSYKGALETATGALKSAKLSKSAIRDTANSMRNATQTFVTTVKGLGTPGTTAGTHAKDTLTSLSTALDEDVKVIQQATAGASALTAVSVVSTTLLTAQAQITSAVTELKAVDAKGELKAAFDTASSCSS